MKEVKILKTYVGNLCGRSGTMSNVDGKQSCANVPERYLSNKGKIGNTHMGDNAASDHATSVEEVQDCAGGKGTASTVVEVPIVLEPVIANGQAKADAEAVSTEVMDVSMSIGAEAGSGNGGQSAAGEDLLSNTNGPGHEVLGDRDWWLLAVTILKKNGKEAEWKEIVDTWVRLQRSWEDVKVCPVLKSI